MPQDFETLVGLLDGCRQVVLTPNAVTECSDLLRDTEEDADAKRSLKELLEKPSCLVVEEYVPSRDASRASQYEYLGVADCAMLSLVDADTILVTADARLAMEAQRINPLSVNFNHYRNFV